MLGLPNANSINWTLVKSWTSDSASTQKCLNKLIHVKRHSDEERFHLLLNALGGESQESILKWNHGN